MIKRFLLTLTILIAPFSWAVFQDDSAGYATVTVNAANIDEAVRFHHLRLQPACRFPHGDVRRWRHGRAHAAGTSSDGATQYAAWPCG